jgi:ubiquinone/menaquinone biosynthesis C-methylase UbiE
VDKAKILADNIKFHNYIADNYDDLHSSEFFISSNQERLDKLICNFASMCKGERFLDVGCGTGHLSKIANRHFKMCVGVDISEAMLKKARSSINNLAFADILQLPFKEDSFDMIGCHSVLHHLSDPVLFVKIAYRLLRPGGILFTDYDLNALSPKYFPTIVRLRRTLFRVFPFSIIKGGLYKYYNYKKPDNQRAKKIEKIKKSDSELQRLWAQSNIQHSENKGFNPYELKSILSEAGFRQTNVFVYVYDGLRDRVSERKVNFLTSRIYPLIYTYSIK